MLFINYAMILFLYFTYYLKLAEKLYIILLIS
jgi:hypothetical protein